MEVSASDVELLRYRPSDESCTLHILPGSKRKIVGGSSSQEEKLRFGTAFSFLAQISLGASVWTVYTQWLWRTVRRKDMTVGVFNSAFGADTSVWSLLNFEMLRKLRTGSAMALFAWHVYEPSS